MADLLIAAMESGDVGNVEELEEGVVVMAHRLGVFIARACN